MITLFFIVGLSSCTTYKSVVRDTDIYEEFSKSDIMKKNLQPGNKIIFISNGTTYKKYVVALLRPEEITVVKANPKLNKNNYFSFLYENIDSLAVKIPPLDDELGISVTVALILFYILI
jgi:hypothetical protein